MATCFFFSCNGGGGGRPDHIRLVGSTQLAVYFVYRLSGGPPKQNTLGVAWDGVCISLGDGQEHANTEHFQGSP